MARRPQARYRPGSGRALLARPKPAAKPKAATSPPPGSYDPAIDAQVGQTQRGLQDLLSDYVRDFGEPGTALGGRSGEDLLLGRGDVERGFGRGVADTERGFGRSLTDLLLNRDRGREDHARAIEGLDRSYARLGSAQTQNSIAAGVQRGGALAQAVAKRAANRAIDQQPVDTGFARFNEDSAQAESRLGEDRGLALGRLGEDRGLALGALNRGFLRSTDDAATQLARAQRENAQFGLDAAAQRFYQANLPLPVPGSPKPKPKPKRRSSNTLGTNRGVR